MDILVVIKTEVDTQCHFITTLNFISKYIFLYSLYFDQNDTECLVLVQNKKSILAKMLYRFKIISSPLAGA